MDIYGEFVPVSRLVREWALEDLKTATDRGIVAAAIHGACYLCHRAIAEGVLTAADALGDNGLVHELAHAAAGDVSRDSTMLEQFARRAEEIEAALAAI